LKRFAKDSKSNRKCRTNLILEKVGLVCGRVLSARAPRINEYRCWVLRFASKGKRGAPKYLYTVESPFEGKNLQSLGHAKYLLNFGLKVDLKNPYGSEEINVQEYSTSEKHEKEDGD